MLATGEQRVQFDFEIDFSNGGGLQGQGFRLDLHSDEISDQQLAEYIVSDLRLLMVSSVRILNKQIIAEPHKRGVDPALEAGETSVRLVDLSHTIRDGMVTLKGYPAPLLCDFLSRENSRRLYEDDTSFQIGKIEMIANTGTYLDSPFHRFAWGKDMSELSLEQLASIDSVVVRVTGSGIRSIEQHHFAALDVRNKAVLVHTGWSAHWGTDQYFEGHPFLTEAAALYLKEGGAALVGIDSLNIDDTDDGRRPVHTTLLEAGIPIVEHLCNLDHLPLANFTFTAVPVKVAGMGSFPVRAFATI